MIEKAFQDFYPEYFAHCYGCGSMNELGHQSKVFGTGKNRLRIFNPSRITLPFRAMSTADCWLR